MVDGRGIDDGVGRKLYGDDAVESGVAAKPLFCFATTEEGPGVEGPGC